MWLAFEWPVCPLAGARVRVECKDDEILDMIDEVEGVTDETGTYKIAMEGDHDGQLWEVVLVSSPMSECATIEQGREGASSGLYNFQQWHCLQHKACQQLELPQGFSSGRLCSVAETVSTFWFWKRISGMSSWVFLEFLSCMWFFYAHWIRHMNLGISLLFYAYIYFPCTS